MGPRRRTALRWGVALLLVAGTLALFRVSREREARVPGPEAVVAEATAPPPPTREGGVLTVATSVPYPPFEFPGPSGPEGFDIDLVEEVGVRLDLEVRVVDGPYDGIFSRLVAKEYDAVVAASPITAELEEVVNMSEPYFRLNQALAVNETLRPDVEGAADLVPGDAVAVVEGSTGHGWAVEHLQPAGVTVQPFPTSEEAFGTLLAGDMSAVIVDETTTLAEVASRPGLRVVETIPTGEGFGIAVDPGNPALLDAVNRVLGEIVEDGTYDLLYDRYADALPPGGRVSAPEAGTPG